MYFPILPFPPLDLRHAFFTRAFLGIDTFPNSSNRSADTLSQYLMPLELTSPVSHHRTMLHQRIDRASPFLLLYTVEMINRNYYFAWNSFLLFYFCRLVLPVASLCIIASSFNPSSHHNRHSSLRHLLHLPLPFLILSTSICYFLNG
jgi:hypothetical protein